MQLHDVRLIEGQWLEFQVADWQERVSGPVRAKF